MKKELEIEFEKDYSGNIKVEYSLKENDIEVEISGSLKKYHTGRADEYEFQPSYFTNEESETYYDENWEKIEEQILSAFYTKKLSRGGMIAKDKLAFGLLSFEELENIFNVQLFGLNEDDTEKLLDKLKDGWFSLETSERIEILNEYHPNWKKYAEGGMMAKGGEIRRFDRHKQMDSETRGEILDTINEFYLIEGFKNLQNYLYGLFDGYDYSQTDSFKDSMRKLKTREKSIYDRIERIYDKIDQYSFEQMADGGMMAKGGVTYGSFGSGRLNKNAWISANYIGDSKVSLGDLQSYLERNTNEKFDKDKIYTITRTLYKSGEFVIDDNKDWRESKIYRKRKMADGGMMAKGGMTKRKRYAEMEKGGIIYDIEWKDEEGDTFEISFDSLEKAKEEIKQIEKEGGRIVQTWKYKDGEYVGRFEYGGELEYDVTDEDRGYFNQYMKEAKEIYGEEKWDNLSRQEKIDATKYLKQKGWIGYKKGGFIRKRF